MNIVWHKFQHIFSWLLFIGSLTLLLFIGLGVFNVSSATAVVRQQEETPQQMLYQSRQTLRDSNGKTWQAIAFKRVSSQGTTSFSLRLVGFPGTAVLERNQPMTLTSSLGKILTAPDISLQIFTNTAPEPHIGQYDLQPILLQLQPEIPWVLEVPTVSSSKVKLSVPSWVVQEWQTVGSS